MVNISPSKQVGAPRATAGDPRWPRVVARDPTADGHFWYGVATTGIYCRPSCHARTAKPQNVSFYATQAAAVAAGFRACKRCRPDGVTQAAAKLDMVCAVCRLIDQSEQAPSLEELAAAAGFSAGYLHRSFKAATGLTPREYAVARRSMRIRAGLGTDARVTDVIYDAGFNSNGRFYESSSAVLGMTPTRYRTGGAREDIRFAVGECSLGAILVASSDKGVAAISIGDDPAGLVHALQDKFARANLIGADGAYEALVARVVGLVEFPAVGLDLPLDVRGTAFQQRVWKALREIPAGRTATYAEIARRSGVPSAVRAVAGACGANAIAVAIPCHRVIRSDGALSGYRWGIERKRELLQRESGAVRCMLAAQPHGDERP